MPLAAAQQDTWPAIRFELYQQSDLSADPNVRISSIGEYEQILTNHSTATLMACSGISAGVDLYTNPEEFSSRNQGLQGRTLPDQFKHRVIKILATASYESPRIDG